MRLRHAPITKAPFDIPKNGDAKEYFTRGYGIILGIEKQIKNTKLKVSDIHDNYIRDLTLHESQEEIERNCKSSI